MTKSSETQNTSVNKKSKTKPSIKKTKTKRTYLKHKTKIRTKSKTLMNRKSNNTKSTSNRRNTVSNRSKSVTEDKIIKKITKISGITFTKGGEITTKVETLTGADLTQLVGNYAVVDKADGLRSVLYLDDTGQVHLLNTKAQLFSKTNITCSGCSSLYNSLIDTEYIENIKTYFVFDVIIFNNKDVRNQPFEERHELLLKFKDIKWSSTDESNIITKQYIIPTQEDESFFKACREVYFRKHPYYLDGLVFTPLKGDYLSKSLKWKPLKDLTIDFIVKIRKQYQDKGKTYLIVDLFTTATQKEIRYDGLRFPRGYNDYFPMIDDTFMSVPYPFMPEYDNKHSYCIIEVVDKKSNKSTKISYSGNESMEDESAETPEYFYKKVEIEEDNSKYLGVSKRKSTLKPARKIKLIPIMDNTVVEFNYNVNSRDNNPARKWIPFRFRRDRTIQYWTNLYHNEKRKNKLLSGPNARRKANVIWKMYQNPITKDMIFGLTPLPKLYYVTTDIDRKHTRNMIQFHLYIKEMLYSSHFYYKNYSETLLELSAGDGSDASNIVKQNAKYVLMVDIISTSLTKAAIDFKKFQNKYRRYKTVFDTKPLDLREESVSKIAPFVKKEGFRKFDVVSIQFSFHYMMETKQSFQNLFNTIKTYTKPGGFYFMTCFDGGTVYKLLKKKREHVITVIDRPDQVLYKIEKMYPDNVELEDLDMFGTPLNVYIYTIGSHIEYLVDFKKLVKYFKKNGFDLIDTKLFHKIAPEWENTNRQGLKLSKPEQEFSFLNRYAVFQRKY